MKPETYTIAQAAEVLGISKATAYRMVKDGEINLTRLHNAKRVTREEIDRLKSCPFEEVAP